MTNDTKTAIRDVIVEFFHDDDEFTSYHADELAKRILEIPVAQPEPPISWTEFWVGHDDDLDAVIDAAPRYSVIRIVNHRPGGVRIINGAGAQIIMGISQEEYDAHAEVR
jgi:hypothetical protein